MAVDVNEVKQRVELICAKDQKTIYLNADKFNKYAPLALDMVISAQRKKFEAGATSSDALSTIKVRDTFNIDPDTGQLTKPDDFMYYTTMYKRVYSEDKNGKQSSYVNSIDLVSDSELGERLGNQLKPPTKSFPIAVQYDGYIQLYPENVGIVELIYLREPLQPFWNYTVSSNEQVYAESGGVATNPNTGVAGSSTDFELPYQFKDDLIWTICMLLGVTVRQPDLTQASLQLNQGE